MLIHNGHKPYTCGSCGRGFSHSYILKQHMRIHNRHKPYTCGSCGRGFTYSHNLKQHMLIHTGESHILVAHVVNVIHNYLRLKKHGRTYK